MYLDIRQLRFRQRLIHLVECQDDNNIGIEGVRFRPDAARRNQFLNLFVVLKNLLAH